MFESQDQVDEFIDALGVFTDAKGVLYVKTSKTDCRKVDDIYVNGVSFSAKGKLIDYNNNIDGFDEIVIGSPLWNGKFPPAINSVLYQTDLKDKKVTFVISSGGGEAPKLEKKINKEYPNSKLIVLREIKKNKEQFDKLKEL